MPETQPAKKSPAFSITCVGCFLHLNKRQERKVQRMFQPYSDGSKKWRQFETALEKLGANRADHEIYGGLSFYADDETAGREIARQAIKLLNLPDKST